MPKLVLNGIDTCALLSLEDVEVELETHVMLQDCETVKAFLYSTVDTYQLLSDAKDKRNDEQAEMLKVGEELRGNLNTIINLRDKQNKKLASNNGWLRLTRYIFIGTTIAATAAYLAK